MKLIFISIFFLAFLGCSKTERPVENNIIKAQSSSNQILNIKSYDIPRGIFRGVLWPSPEKNYFEPWIIRNKQEFFYQIPAPPETAKWQADVTDQWSMKETMIKKNTREFFIIRNDKSKSLTIEVPQKKRNYSFSILKNNLNEETVIFMDIDEKISDTGLFGYIVIK